MVRFPYDAGPNTLSYGSRNICEKNRTHFRGVYLFGMTDDRRQLAVSALDRLHEMAAELSEHLADTEPLADKPPLWWTAIGLGVELIAAEVEDIHDHAAALLLVLNDEQRAAVDDATTQFEWLAEVNNEI